MKKIYTEILSTSGRLFAGDCENIYLPTEQGIIGILPGHMNLIAKLVEGEIIINKNTQQEQTFPITAGILEVASGNCNVLVGLDIQ